MSAHHFAAMTRAGRAGSVATRTAAGRAHLSRRSRPTHARPAPRCRLGQAAARRPSPDAVLRCPRRRRRCGAVRCGRQAARRRHGHLRTALAWVAPLRTGASTGNGHSTRVRRRHRRRFLEMKCLSSAKLDRRSTWAGEKQSARSRGAGTGLCNAAHPFRLAGQICSSIYETLHNRTGVHQNWTCTDVFLHLCIYWGCPDSRLLQLSFSNLSPSAIFYTRDCPDLRAESSLLQLSIYLRVQVVYQ